MSDGAPVVLTIGHSNHALDRFIALLEANGVEVVVDVRTVPRSGYSPHFDQAPLKTALAERGVRYLFLGAELGGRPTGDEFYDAEDHVRYDRLAEAPFFEAGIGRLLEGASQYRVAMMCSEEDPSQCHRHLLVARVLTERGAVVEHIRGDGEIALESDLPPHAELSVQSDLFGTEEQSSWRSIRPVSRSGRPSGSSRP